MSATDGIAWLDGRLVSRERARVSVDDFGFRYGLTCFETMLARHGRVFRLDEHLDRLEASLRLFRAPPPSRVELEPAIAATLVANGLSEASVRLSVSPGVGGRPALPAAAPVTVVVTADPVPPSPPPVRLVVSSVRIDAARPWRGAKVGQFAPYLLARAEASEAGYDDALLLNHAGRIVEAATANVFLVLDGGIVTPPIEDGPLPGVTRAAVLEVARGAGLEAREASLDLEDLARAQAAFLTSSVAGVTRVRSVAWPEGAVEPREWVAEDAGGVVSALAAAYEELVEAETRSTLPETRERHLT